MHAASRQQAPTPADDAAQAIARQIDPAHVTVVEDTVVEPEVVPAPVVVDDAATDATPAEIAPLVPNDVVMIEPARASIVQQAAIEPSTATAPVESTNAAVPHTASLFDTVPQTPEPESTEPKLDGTGDPDDEERRA